MERSERLVMSRVLVAGVGWCSGGRPERSRLRDTLEERLDAREDACGLRSGDDVAEAILCMMVSECI